MKAKLYNISTDLNICNERTSEVDGTVTITKLSEVITAIKDVLNDHKDLTCLCAPQIGLDYRVFVVKTAGNGSGDSRYKVYINPMIIKKTGYHMSLETNPSFPKKYFIVPRYNELGLAYQDIYGNPTAGDFKGVFAEVIQQMVEMLDGVTLMDYALDLDDVGGLEKFNKASKKDKVELIQMYLSQLDNFNKDLKENLNENESWQHLEKTIKFMEGIMDGSIVPTNPVKVEEENASDV